MTTTNTTPHEYEPPEGWINPRSLSICRKRMNLDYDNMEELTDIPIEKVIKWENSDGIPTLAELETLSKLYRCPVGYFFLDAPPSLYDEKLVNFRGLASGKLTGLSYETRLKIDEFISLTDALSEIVHEMGAPSYPNISQANPDEDIMTVVDRERRKLGFNEDIRNSWESPMDAFLFWKTAIEKSGVFVISLKLKATEVRGASRWDKSYPATILVNRYDAEATTGRTFTLLHEWAHLILREPGIICDFVGHDDKAHIETFANRFAARMMVSWSELEDYLKAKEWYYFNENWRDSTIKDIKDFFKVSRDVIAITLEELTLAPEGFYKNKRVSWDKHEPFFRGKPGAAVKGRTKIKHRFNELGLPFSELIAKAYASSSIPITNLTRLLNMKMDKIPEFVSFVKENK